MGMFLNSRIPFDAYRATASGKYFVDKTPLIAELIPALGTDGRFLCITRPRRFGKSVMASMAGAFFGKAADAHEIFRKLEIAGPKCSKKLKNDRCGNYTDYMNQYNVIWIDFSETPENCVSYKEYIDRISQGLKNDLILEFPNMDIDPGNSLWDIFTQVYLKTNEKFIFVMDEWDAVFHMSFITQTDRRAYLLFLRSLLKSKVYVELAYMTGILPIAKYSDGSELNMFTEYNMATAWRFSEFFGFSDDEVDGLYSLYKNTTERAKISREDLRIWYDGYYTAGGERLYNPRSVICALSDNQLRNYWTSSGTYDSVFNYIKDHEGELQDDLALLFAGEEIPSDIHEYAATSMCLETRDEIFSAMVIYGLLTYRDGCVSIPNRELMDSYAAMMKREKSLGYIYRLANISQKMLSATLNGDTGTMTEILKYAHDTESPIFSYNSEIELSAIVNLVYLSARDKYRVEREDKAGKGYVDFIFYPNCRDRDALILELKVDSTPEKAILQIKDKNYALRLKGKLGETPQYTGRILAVGISYNKKTKEHSCLVEEL